MVNGEERRHAIRAIPGIVIVLSVLAPDERLDVGVFIRNGRRTPVNSSSSSGPEAPPTRNGNDMSL
jgi:hypothetical protein